MASVPKVVALARSHGSGIVPEVLINFILPYLIYRCARHDLGNVGALMASSAPPILWSLVEFIRVRRIDALSMLVIGGIVLSLLAFLGGGSVKFLQLREKLVTVVIGLVFLGSAAIRRPLIYQITRAQMVRRSSSRLADFEAHRDNVDFRRTMTTMTVVWGSGLVAEAALSGLLVFNLSIERYLLVSPLLGYGVMGSLGLWTFWYARRRRRRALARQAMEAQGAASGGRGA